MADYEAKMEERVSEFLVLDLARDHAALMIESMDDDAVFENSFHFYSGICLDRFFGVAWLVHEGQKFCLSGMYGNPDPDPAEFCRALSAPFLKDFADYFKAIRTVSVGDEIPFERFDKRFQKYLAGINVMPVPLVLNDEEANGMIILYKKGEQEFNTLERRVAKYMGEQIALAVSRND